MLDQVFLFVLASRLEVTLTVNYRPVNDVPLKVKALIS